MQNISTITCCGSCELTPISEPIEGSVNNTRMWSITYKCDKCGSICDEV